MWDKFGKNFFLSVENLKVKDLSIPMKKYEIKLLQAMEEAARFFGDPSPEGFVERMFITYRNRFFS